MMKKSILYNCIIIVICLLTSCNIQFGKDNYKKIIKSYFKENMNDPKSYEPVSFEIIDLLNINIEEIYAQWAQVENVYQRKLDLIPKIVEVVKNIIEKELLTTLVEQRVKIKSYSIYSMTESRTIFNLKLYKRYIDLNNELDSTIQKITNKLENSKIDSKMEYEDLLAQMEGTQNRIIVENRQLKKKLSKYGFSLDGNVTNNSHIICVKHKFRGKNSFGALILYEYLFIIDIENNQVLNVEDFSQY